MKIEVRQLTKQYKNKFALNHVSFTLEEPKIYGLLGRNGAGKTTFMDMLAGNILPTKGDIFVNGERPFDNRHVQENVCLIKEGNNFKKEWKVIEVIRLYSFFYPKFDQQLAKQLLSKYNLNPNAKVKTLSKGMESALGITVGLASKTPITIFDEPYIGLDAAARKQFYDVMLQEYENEKRMIIFSTHLIDEVSLMFEEVLILQQGGLVLQKSAEALRQQTISVTGRQEQVKAFIKNKQLISKKEFMGMMTAYVFADRQEAKEEGLEVESIPTQDLMIQLTEKEREDRHEAIS
ncbi:ABC transporter ATP-binding protein [Virgibacillus dokdonensis]|uniref:ABC transporter ATP-binding protein YtrB n=1 Tax=Virgibacillus dokdonensis TaxID=302167 RepID=A0A2K9J0J8_9BACI|nr:ABC transporter ATP-binding protein [Virgibacillus dokdonensis]AUJ25436.1 ABC transporter ATP-binding protein YtrB [Virgibacillus dokdonensis]